MRAFVRSGLIHSRGAMNCPLSCRNRPDSLAGAVQESTRSTRRAEAFVRRAAVGHEHLQLRSQVEEMIDSLLDILTRHRVPEQVYEDLIQHAETENEQVR